MCKKVFYTIISPIMEPNAGQNKQKTSFWSEIFEWLKVLIIAIAISIPIRLFIAEPFIVNGASMDSTFETGQFLIVDRLTYRFNKPVRGDVIVFRYPNNPKVYYIKRIIGLPGETIDINEGIISIKDGTTGTTTILEEIYVDKDKKSFENGHFNLGLNEYFVMGDNRLASSDSRVWGNLKEELIIGRPIIRIFPITKLSIFPGNYK